MRGGTVSAGDIALVFIVTEPPRNHDVWSSSSSEASALTENFERIQSNPEEDNACGCVVEFFDEGLRRPR